MVPTTAKTTTKTVKTAPKVDKPDPQAGFHPRRVDAAGNPEELHGKHWKKVD